MKPWLCCICGNKLHKNMRANAVKTGCKGGKCHEECLERERNNKEHEKFCNKLDQRENIHRRNLYITKVKHQYMKERWLKN